MKRYAIFAAVLLLALGYACNQVDQVASGGSKLFLTAQPTEIRARGISTLTVTGTRGNGSGAPLPDGTVVSFRIEQAGTVTPNPVEMKDGQAVARFQAAGFSGKVKVTATSGEIASSAVEINVGEARVDKVLVSANPPTLPLGGGTSEIRAVVLDEDGNQLEGIGVQFTTTAGVLRSGGKILHTNQSGVVKDILETTEDATVTATSLDGSFEDTGVTVGTSDVSCDFISSPVSPEVGQRVFFVDTSDDPTGTLVSFRWDFGDGSTGSGKTTEHVYRFAGDFQVVHTVTDSAGSTFVCTKMVTVTEPENGLECLFTSSPADPQKGERITFDASGSTDSNGTIVEYQWNFGDSPSNTTEGDAITTHVYSSAGEFTVTLTITDDQGNTKLCSETVTVAGGGGGGNLPPTCGFSINPASGTTATAFDYDGSTSSDSDGTITSYSWDFGDSNNGTGITTTHTYAVPATYTVTLTVKDDNGATSSCSQSLVVASNFPPVCNFTISPATGPFATTTFNFNALLSSDSDGSIVSYSWNCGDAPPCGLSGVNVNHSYAASGTYTVTLTVTDDAGASTSCTKTVTAT